MSRSFALALLASSALIAPAVRADELPTGGQLAAGAASIANAPGALTITQSSDRAVINWQSFSLGAGGRIDIAQPGSGSALLNRVIGSTTSMIAGQIHANGQVFLVNPNGILITATGSVSAAGFVASSLNLTDSQFMNGDIIVTGRGGSVVNRGNITIVKGGYAALIGGSVDNSGMIVAPLGKVALGSGTRATLDLTGDGFLQIAVPSPDIGGVAMSGRISADGGTVLLSAASALDAARHTVNLSGTIEARGVEGRSGAVVLTGGAITFAGATIDVSGVDGGGSVRIGGDRQGFGSLAHADTVDIDAGSTIDASATVVGNGGNVVVWSDTATTFAGTIVARGAGGGSGGNAEVSSHGRLGYSGTADLTGGTFGTLLLDPFNVTISTAASADQSAFTATGNDSVIQRGHADQRARPRQRHRIDRFKRHAGWHDHRDRPAGMDERGDPEDERSRGDRPQRRYHRQRRRSDSELWRHHRCLRRRVGRGLHAGRRQLGAEQRDAARLYGGRLRDRRRQLPACRRR